MAFPLTHLCVAWRILENHTMNEEDAAQFMLGSISPDAVHYRREFLGANMSNIGAAKKITHLCPVSDERWGHVTDKEGWIKIIKNFLRENPGSFAEGYAAHTLTDIHNNVSIWRNFCDKFPEEAARGYSSDYYVDLRNIDTLLYRQFPDVPLIMEKLSKSVADGFPGLVSTHETEAIKNNILHEHFKNPHFSPEHVYRFVTYEDTIKFIEEAAEFSAKIIYNN